jgi:hypothetical protein
VSRKLAHLLLGLTLVGLIAGPVQAGKKRGSPAPITYFMNWDGDCTAGGYLSLAPVPNPSACAQYVPAADTSHIFRATGQAPFVLDATKTIAVDFEIDHIVTGAAEFEVVLEATFGKDTKVIASGTHAVTAATGLEPTAVHLELEPDAALHMAKVSYLAATVAWTEGATWSRLDMESGNASIAFNAAR